MPRIANTPQAIMKYTMRSLLPGLGSSRGHWTRVYFDLKSMPSNGGSYKKKTLADKAMRKADALKYIKDHGFVLLAKDKDNELYGNPNGEFRDYARDNGIEVPEGIGTTTIGEGKREEI